MGLTSPAQEPSGDGRSVASDPVWQRLWVSIADTPWSTLALIPSDPGVAVAGVARGLVEVARPQSTRTIRLLDAVGVEAESVQLLIGYISGAARRGERLVIICDSIAENPVAVPVVRSASAALVVVCTGTSRLASLRAIAETIGRDRLYGSVVIE